MLAPPWRPCAQCEPCEMNESDSGSPRVITERARDLRRELIVLHRQAAAEFVRLNDHGVQDFADALLVIFWMNMLPATMSVLT